MTDPKHAEPVEVTQLRVASDRFYPGLHYIEGGPFRILFWTIATNIDPIDPAEGVRRLRFADELVAAWNTRTAAEAASRAEVERLREALQDVVSPLAYLQRYAKAEGRQISGQAYAIANDLAFVQDIARSALSAIDGEG